MRMGGVETPMHTVSIVKNSHIVHMVWLSSFPSKVLLDFVDERLKIGILAVHLELLGGELG